MRLWCLGLVILTAGGWVIARDQGKNRGPKEPATEAKQDKELVAVLLEALKDGDADVRTNAATALKSLGSRAVPGLIETCRGKDKKLRRAALEVIENVGLDAFEALPALIAILKDKSEDIEFRCRVSGAICHIITLVQAVSAGCPGCPRPPTLVKLHKQLVPVLADALNDTNREIRDNAANALGGLGPVGVPALASALKGRDQSLRATLAKILGEMGPDAKGALPALIQVMREKHAEKEVRRSVSAAISQIVAETK